MVCLENQELVLWQCQQLLRLHQHRPQSKDKQQNQFFSSLHRYLLLLFTLLLNKPLLKSKSWIFQIGKIGIAQIIKWTKKQKIKTWIVFLLVSMTVFLILRFSRWKNCSNRFKKELFSKCKYNYLWTLDFLLSEIKQMETIFSIFVLWITAMTSLTWF